MVFVREGVLAFMMISKPEFPEDFFEIAAAFAVPRVVNAGKDIHTIAWCLSQAVSLSHSWTVTNCQPPYRREHLQSPASRLSFESTSRPHHG